MRVKFGVLCVSDRCSAGICEDQSGKAILDLIAPLADASVYRLVPDDRAAIETALCDLADVEHADVILTTGGTGFAPRDVTPEATLAVIDRAAPGIAEAVRLKSLAITPNAMLSRAVSGIRGKTLIINLPGSPKAVRESLAVVLPVLPHAVETLAGNTQNCGGNYGK
ncbi:MAG: molybdopterin adenylyltransferase [Clostridia bacterium]|nr:molybdopterin adenylyltransferase [Clostridia bacterium]MBR3552269.1 molybdopterin adenylyltransferase [Clostridia bacterium]